MESTHYLDDFRRLYDTLLSHPLFIDLPEQLSAFQQLYGQAASQITNFESFISAASSLTVFFCDGHTNIEIPYTENDLCLPIPCKWQDDKLILTADFEQTSAGAEIAAIENTPVASVLHKLATRIPHENIFLVKSRTTEYPYRNCHIFSDLNLAWIFGKKESYSVTVRAGGEAQTYSIPLTPYNGYPDFSDEDFVSWNIDGNAATLRLDACICNDEYLTALQQLAEACARQNVRSLTLDLSRNMGGSSEVIERFLEYVNVDTFHRYEMTDYSSGAPVTICSRSEVIENDRKSRSFPNNIFCKVGNTTFSSARTFAVTLKDNGIATIIGDPTGGKPSSYGMPRKYTLQNTGIRFRVSRAWFGRPCKALDSLDALFPEHSPIG